MPTRETRACRSAAAAFTAVLSFLVAPPAAAACKVRKSHAGKSEKKQSNPKRKASNITNH